MQITQNKRVEQSYRILDSLRLDNGLYRASLSEEYRFTWLRDNFYMSLPYLNKSCNTYTKTLHRIIDLLHEYDWKLSYHTQVKPVHPHEYLHARYSLDGKELPVQWGHSQNDNPGCILWAIGQGEQMGKRIIRNSKDKEILQKLVWYLEKLEYYKDKDSGFWEEEREVRASSIGACVAGLIAVKDIVSVPNELIINGIVALYKLYPRETETREVDFATLSLIYPYNLFEPHLAKVIIQQTEEQLLRRNGCIRYKGDSYYSTIEKIYGRHHPKETYYNTEAEWTMGLTWLALCHLQLGNIEKAKEYIEWTEKVMLENGSLPELYYAGSDTCGPNNPLGWSSSLYILAVEEYYKHML